MRIAMVSTYPPTQCGVAIYTQSLVNALIRKDEIEEIVVLCNKTVNKKDTYTEETIGSKKIKEYRTWSRTIRSWLNLIKILKIERPNIVHIQHEPSMYCRDLPFRELFFQYFFGNKYNLLVSMYCRRNNIPLVWTLHYIPKRKNIVNNCFVKKIQSYLFYLESEAQKPLFESFSGVLNFIVHSSSERMTLEEYEFKNCKIFTILHGASFPSNFGTIKKSQNEKILLHFGFIQPYKGIHNTIKALRKVLSYNSNVKLIIAGGMHPAVDFRLKKIITKYVQTLREMIRKYNLTGNINFLFKYLNNDEKNKIFSSADILMLPHERLTNLQSGVLFDASGYKVPVIATNGGEMGEMVRLSGGGWLVDNPKDVDELANVILEAIKDENEIKIRGENLYRYMKEHASWDVVADMHVQVYKTVINQMERT